MQKQIRAVDDFDGCGKLPPKEQLAMPNINSVVNDQIRRLARREINAGTKVVRRATVQYRHAIAALKQQVAEIAKRLAQVERQRLSEGTASPEVPEKARFRAMGVKAHRAE